MLDHILPKAAGGKDGWKNRQTLCQPCNHLKADRHIDYRDDERRLKAEDRSDCGRQPPTDLENLAAATGALDIAHQRWYKALSAEHPPQDVAAAAGNVPACAVPDDPPRVDGQP